MRGWNTDQGNTASRITWLRTRLNIRKYTKMKKSPFRWGKTRFTEVFGGGYDFSEFIAREGLYGLEVQEVYMVYHVAEFQV